jgi:hypothetical protein
MSSRNIWLVTVEKDNPFGGSPSSDSVMAFLSEEKAWEFCRNMNDKSDRFHFYDVEELEFEDSP